VSTVERCGRNSLTIVDGDPGTSSGVGYMGPDGDDALARFGRGRMHYAAQWMSAFTYNYLLEQVRKLHPRSVLHLGCGSDMLRSVLEANYCHVERYVGVDLHLPWLREALRRANGIRGEYYCVDLSKGDLTFGQDEFDVVVAVELIEHMPTKEMGTRLFERVIETAKDAAFVATPKALRGTVHFSDFHRYEFSGPELAEMSRGAARKFPTVHVHGINVGSADFETEMQSKQPEWLRQATEYLGEKVMRGVWAAGHPEQARDVMMHFSK